MKQSKTRELTASQQALIGLLAKSVFHADFTPAPDTDWAAVLEEAIHQTVFSQVYAAAKDQLPAELRAAHAKRFFQSVTKNLNVILAHESVHTLLTGNGIPYVILKGCASAEFYEEPTLRSMGDVDLYVRKEDMERVRQLLLAEGYTQEVEDHQNHWAFRRDRIDVEVHWAVTGVPTADNEVILDYLKDLIETASERSVGDAHMVLPDAFHHGLVMLLHMVSHMTAGGIGLRHLLDWLAFQNSLSEEDFLACFEAPLKRIRLWRFTQVLAAVGERYFGCTPRAYSAEVPEALTRSLVLDLFDAGNFGAKDANRLNESKLLRNNETRQIDGKTGLGHLLSFINQRARTAMPAAKKHPILLPAAWVKVLVKRRRDVKAGIQPKLHLKQTLDGAKARQSVYEQLRLFEE